LLHSLNIDAGVTATREAVSARVTATRDALPRRIADFATLGEALDYAAQGQRGLNFFDARATLARAYPYAELRRDALDQARRLIAAGVTPGERVALIAETSAEFAAAFFGAVYAGALPTPLPLPTSFGGRDAYVEQIRTQLGGKRVLPAASADDIAYLQYSSGSTRFPHGVAVTHRALLANLAGHAISTQVREDDRIVSWLPWYHDMGLVGCLLSPLANQMSGDYLATEDFARRPLSWLTLVSRNEGHTLSYSPTFGYDICARRVSSTIDVAARFDLSRWRVAGNGADMIRPDVMQHFVDVFDAAGFQASAFLPSYGLAEATLAVSMMPIGEGIVTDLVDERVLSGEGRAGPVDKLKPIRYRAIVNCGKALPGLTVEVRGEDSVDGTGDALPDRRIGRIYVHGEGIMAGYFRDPEATAACLQDGWLDTGDMGYLVDGYIYIVGRAKDMIIINGKNHWPQDIEWAIEQLPGFKAGDIAAFSITSPAGEEEPAVLVQCRTSDVAERMILRDAIRNKVRNITGMTCVVELVPPRTLPRTSSGKLSRSKARLQYLSGEIQPFEIAA
jgi:fatty-acyl-CoA synthase